MELSRRSPGSSVEVCDVSDSEGFAGALGRIEEARGRIDILINNAGVDLPLPVPGGDVATVRDVLDVNFFSVVTGTLAVIPGMVERGSGIVVNVSSDTVRAPQAGQGAYVASKAAISAFTDSVAHEVAPRGVSVHALYPGWVPTAMALAGNEDTGWQAPRVVRRTADGVAGLVADRMGGPKIDINAVSLALVAPLVRTIAPGLLPKGDATGRNQRVAHGRREPGADRTERQRDGEAQAEVGSEGSASRDSSADSAEPSNPLRSR